MTWGGAGRVRDRHRPAGQVVAEITSKGGRAVASGADISDHGAAEDLVKTAIAEFGRLDILVNVAGILRDRMIFNMTAEEWDAVIRVHLRGTFNTSKFAAGALAVHPRRDRQQPHHQLHLRLRAARRAGPAQLRRRENGHRRPDLLPGQLPGRYGATANAISPGAATRMTDSVPDERRRTPASTATDERSPDNVAPVVAYLASERSSSSPARSSTPPATRSPSTTSHPLIRLIGTQPWTKSSSPPRSSAASPPRSSRTGDGPSARAAKPAPVPTPETQPYWDGCAAGELRLQRCADCSAAFLLPAAVLVLGRGPR